MGPTSSVRPLRSSPRSDRPRASSNHQPGAPQPTQQLPRPARTVGPAAHVVRDQPPQSGLVPAAAAGRRGGLGAASWPPHQHSRCQHPLARFVVTLGQGFAGSFSSTPLAAPVLCNIVRRVPRRPAYGQVSLWRTCAGDDADTPHGVRHRSVPEMSCFYLVPGAERRLRPVPLPLREIRARRYRIGVARSRPRGLLEAPGPGSERGCQRAR